MNLPDFIETYTGKPLTEAQRALVANGRQMIFGRFLGRHWVQDDFYRAFQTGKPRPPLRDGFAKEYPLTPPASWRQHARGCNPAARRLRNLRREIAWLHWLARTHPRGEYTDADLASIARANGWARRAGRT